LTSEHNELESSYAVKKLPASSSSSAAPCSLLKELLTSRPSTGYRRPSIDRPSSVTDVSLSAMLPQLLSPSLETVEIASSRGLAQATAHGARRSAVVVRNLVGGPWRRQVVQRGLHREGRRPRRHADARRRPSESPVGAAGQQSRAARCREWRQTTPASSTIDFNMSFSHDVEKSSEPPIEEAVIHQPVGGESDAPAAAAGARHQQPNGDGGRVPPSAVRTLAPPVRRRRAVSRADDDRGSSAVSVRRTDRVFGRGLHARQPAQHGGRDMGADHVSRLQFVRRQLRQRRPTPVDPISGTAVLHSDPSPARRSPGFRIVRPRETTGEDRRQSHERRASPA
jgi:hypothetical protein